MKTSLAEALTVLSNEWLWRYVSGTLQVNNLSHIGFSSPLILLWKCNFFYVKIFFKNAL